MMRFGPFIRSYFTFNRRERNGILVLLGVVAVFVATLLVQDRLVSLPAYDFGAFDRMAAGLHPLDLKAAKARRDSAGHDERLPTPAQAAGEHSAFAKQELFYFNPNGLSAEDWMRLGLSRAQAQSIKNYEAKGGQFRTKADVQKMHVVSPEFYARVEDHIVIPQPEAATKEETPRPYFAEKKVRTPSMVELNSADTSDLVTLPGIGNVFARRIVAYRNRLGGFCNPEQLMEVFGFDAERYEQVKPYVSAKPEFITRISINSVTAAELKKHPYVTFGIANAIVNYRAMHGPFKTLEALRGVDLVNADLYRKLAPYLTL